MNESCEKFSARLPDYRWLSPRERLPVDRHLAACARCRAEWREAQAADELFAEARAPAPGGFADAVMAAIEAQPLPGDSRWLWTTLGGALVAEAALAFALRINPAPWWQAAKALGGQVVREWGAPVTDVMTLAAAAANFVPPFNAARWVGGLALVTAFVWFTLNHWRTEHA